MTELEAFGERLAQERREKGVRERRDITQRDVAKAIQSTPASMSRWEAGLVWPDEDSLAKLAAYYSVTKAWLRYGVETKSGAPRMEEHEQVSPGSLLTGASGKVTRESRKRKS